MNVRCGDNTFRINRLCDARDESFANGFKASLADQLLSRKVHTSIGRRFTGTMATNTSIARMTRKSMLRTHGDSMLSTVSVTVDPSDLTQRILAEDLFLGILCLERKRAERSNRNFLLLLLDATGTLGTERHGEVQRGLIEAANSARRETDLAGWYKQDSVLGVIFSELGTQNSAEIIDTVVDKIHKSLAMHLDSTDLKQVRVSVHFFSDKSDENNRDVPPDPTFYPDLDRLQKTQKIPFLVKRIVDILGSLSAPIVFSPLFLLISILVKLSSKGPILFRQERLGQFGKTFNCLKFRSMHAANNSKIHHEFMKSVISGAYDARPDGSMKPVYKMTNDPRTTRIGRILRRTSLDELPQFINVLRGDMSLVGPRPPLAYEYTEYKVWHRRRVLEIKPGLTGLWQVKGRSRVRFDDMVRLDLQYARDWSLWLDIQILLKTPGAVLLGDGAY